MAMAGGSALLSRHPVQAQTGGSLLDRLRRDKVAKVAIAAQPPYSGLQPDGTLTGIGPAVTKAVMDKLGVPKLEAVVVPYGDMIPGMMAGRWDFISACLTVTQARCAQALFSPPIVFDPATAAYLDDIKEPPKSLAEIGQQNLTVGVIAGAYMLPKLRSLTAADKVSTYPDMAALIDGLGAKRIQLAVGAYSGLTTLQKQKKFDFKISGPMADVPPSGSGPAFRTTDTELFDAFQKEVMAMKKSGEIAKLNEQFGFLYLPEYDAVTMKEACERAI